MPNWMFRSQIDVFDPFKIFSKYTPLNYNVHVKKKKGINFVSKNLKIIRMVIEHSVQHNNIIRWNI